MTAYRAKPVKTPDHLDVCNVCFWNWVAVRTAAAPQVCFEPKPDIDFTDRGVGSPLNQASLALKKILDEAAG